MSNPVLLDNVEHGALKVQHRHGLEFGDAVNQLLVVPTEFEEVQREYPIFFRKDPDGALHAVALLGLDRGENLFLAKDRWTTQYIPAVQRRGPFFIAVPPDQDCEPTVHIDLDDPRVSESVGEPLFKPHGGNTPYLEQVAHLLFTIHEGLAVAPRMFAAFEEFDLIESVAVNIDIGDGLTYDLPDLFTISADRLSALTGASLERLHRLGFLGAAIFVRSSLGNVARLIELKKLKRAED